MRVKKIKGLQVISKEVLKNRDTFPKDLTNVLEQFMSEKCIESIQFVLKYQNEDSDMFFKDLNKNITTLLNGKFKMLHFLTWYYIKVVILDENYKSIIIPEKLKKVIVKNIYKKYLKTNTLNTKIENDAELVLMDIFERGSKEIYCSTLYNYSYDHWIQLLNSIYDIIVKNGYMDKYLETLKD